MTLGSKRHTSRPRPASSYQLPTLSTCSRDCWLAAQPRKDNLTLPPATAPPYLRTWHMAYGSIMNRSPPSSAFLPLPGSPGSSWAIYKARFRGLFQGADASVLIAFWLFGTCSSCSLRLPTANSGRCYQQCLLRYHPLCGCRPRRALRS